MPFRSTLPITYSQNGAYVPFDELMSILKYEDAKLRPSQVERTLNGYSEPQWIKLVDNKRVVPLKSLVRYVFHRSDVSPICDKLANDIVEHLSLTDKDKSVDGEKPEDKERPAFDEDLVLCDLYKEISDKGLVDWMHHVDLMIDEKTIPSLELIHKDKFTEERWKHICVFENHYSNIHKEKQVPYEKSLQLKNALWRECVQIKLIAEQCMNASRTTITRRDNRKRSASVLKDSSVYASRKHSPLKIEEDLEKYLKLRFSEITSIVVVDFEESHDLNSLDVYIEISTDAVPQGVSAYIQNILDRHHQCGYRQITFLKAGILKDSGKCRFILRDELMQGKVAKFIIHTHCQANAHPVATELEDDNDNGTICSSCYKDLQSDPLDIGSFDAINEWFLDTPLHIQLLFQPFINLTTLHRTENKKTFLLPKIQLHYSVFDTLLHSYNKMYFGILQQANSEELMLGYKSLQTVFEITSGSGCSTSLPVAERRLVLKANPEDMYFATYLKPYSLTYDTAAGIVTSEVRLRDCYTIFMMDNLVRLKINDDPDRGESRSKQLNLLPVTIQGLPKDSSLVSTWHDQKICDGSENCPCKQPVALNKNHINASLFELSEAEQKSKEKFVNLCTWGSSSTWCRAFSNGKSCEVEKIMIFLHHFKDLRWIHVCICL